MNKHHFYVIEQDVDPSSPREDCHLGTMYCRHRRYSLGDVQFFNSLEERKAVLIGWDADRQEAIYNFWLGKYGDEEMAANKLNERIDEEFDRRYISLPLYAYIH